MLTFATRCARSGKLAETHAAIGFISPRPPPNTRCRFALDASSASGSIGVADMNQVALEKLGEWKGRVTVGELVVRSCLLLHLNRTVGRALPLGPDFALLTELKSVLFTVTKKRFWSDTVEATHTPTAPSSDEYDDPRDIRKIKINRIAASRNKGDEKRHLFAQLVKELGGVSSAALRRSFVGSGHGGQARAFFVKFLGEGNNDYGGPYRQIFFDVMSSLQEEGEGLGILKATPNQEGGVGGGQELFMLGAEGVAGEGVAGEEGVEEDVGVEDLRHLLQGGGGREEGGKGKFMGKLIGIAVRSGITVPLRLGEKTFWSRCVGDEVDEKSRLGEVDFLAAKMGRGGDSGGAGFGDVMEGLKAILPMEFLCAFSASEAESVFCGEKEIDLDSVRATTEYEGGFKGGEGVVEMFWSVLKGMTRKEVSSFFVFVAGRATPPGELHFKLQRSGKSKEHLPTASTCFYSLSLSDEFGEAQELRDKLVYAVNNSGTMDADYSTNDKELAQGWGAWGGGAIN